jgi:hypothetical protein
MVQIQVNFSTRKWLCVDLNRLPLACKAVVLPTKPPAPNMNSCFVNVESRSTWQRFFWGFYSILSKNKKHFLRNTKTSSAFLNFDRSEKLIGYFKTLFNFLYLSKKRENFVEGWHIWSSKCTRKSWKICGIVENTIIKRLKKKFIEKQRLCYL